MTIDQHADVFNGPGGWGGGWGGGGMGGFGGGIFGGLLAGLLFRRGGVGGGCEDGDGGCGKQVLNGAILQNLMNNVNSITAAIPTTALQTQNDINGNIAALALATQQGLCGVGTAVRDDGEKTRSMLFQRFQLEDSTAINNLNIQLSEARGRHTSDDLKMQIVNTNTAVASQSQQQQQLQLNDVLHGINRVCSGLFDVNQNIRSTNANVIAGNAGAVTTGAQTSNPTQVGRV